MPGAIDLFDPADPTRLAHWLLRAAQAFAQGQRAGKHDAMVEALRPISYDDQFSFASLVVDSAHRRDTRIERGRFEGVIGQTILVLDQATVQALGLWTPVHGGDTLEILVEISTLRRLEAALPKVAALLQDGRLNGLNADAARSATLEVVRLAATCPKNRTAQWLLRELRTHQALWSEPCSLLACIGIVSASPELWMNEVKRNLDLLDTLDSRRRRVHLLELVQVAGLHRVMEEVCKTLETAYYDHRGELVVPNDPDALRVLRLLFDGGDQAPIRARRGHTQCFTSGGASLDLLKELPGFEFETKLSDLADSLGEYLGTLTHRERERADDLPVPALLFEFSENFLKNTALFRNIIEQDASS